VTLAGLLGSAAAGAAATGAAQRVLTSRPPGGLQRWARTNHRGEPVTLLEGPAIATGLVAAAVVAPGLTGRVRAAAVIAALGAGGLGAYDDLAGSGDRRGLRGHLGALRHGELTSGAVKIVGIGATGLAAAALAGRRGTSVVLAGGVVAATANLVNLLDLRPGRALKAGLILGLLDGRRGGDPARLAALATGSALVVLPADLGERTMLGDAGANALGAVLGLAAVAAEAGPARLAARLAALTALTLVSEKVSYTKVIEATPGLRELDRMGRRPASA
jgi:UDP-N-acetylmuramyl pentapeptide phosphotransferase/UDP-N-acetylglucosamine-1-phosphate transferase